MDKAIGFRPRTCCLRFLLQTHSSKKLSWRGARSNTFRVMAVETAFQQWINSVPRSVLTTIYTITGASSPVMSVAILRRRTSTSGTSALPIGFCGLFGSEGNEMQKTKSLGTAVLIAVIVVGASPGPGQVVAEAKTAKQVTAAGSA